MLYIGIDDTDNLESRGTGQLARGVAAALAAEYPLLGVTRHQLLLDPRVPCTKNNSAACVLLDAGEGVDIDGLRECVIGMILADFQAGSDPGLCIASAVPSAIMAFGRRAQREVVWQDEARELASAPCALLRGLGGDEGGVIGALAAVGLAASGNDGRYVMVGRSRELAGLQPVRTLLGAGIAAVETMDGEPVVEGRVQTDRLRPARRGGRPVAVVEWCGDHWLPLKLD